MRFSSFLSPTVLRAAASIGLCTLALSAAAPRVALAQTPIVDFTPDPNVIDAGAGGDATYGFDFVVTGTQTITSLGIFDRGGDGLLKSHEVGLFDNTGNLLASTTITNALGFPVASTAGNGRYIARAITPVTLTAGTYVLGATYTASDDRFAVFSSVASSPGFTYGQERGIRGSTDLVFPSEMYPTGTSAFGPMAFTGTAVGAPEPGSFALLFLGGASGLMMRGIRRRSPQLRKSYTAAR